MSLASSYSWSLHLAALWPAWWAYLVSRVLRKDFLRRFVVPWLGVCRSVAVLVRERIVWGRILSLLFSVRLLCLWIVFRNNPKLKPVTQPLSSPSTQQVSQPSSPLPTQASPNSHETPSNTVIPPHSTTLPVWSFSAPTASSPRSSAKKLLSWLHSLLWYYQSWAPTEPLVSDSGRPWSRC